MSLSPLARCPRSLLKLSLLAGVALAAPALGGCGDDGEATTGGGSASDGTTGIGGSGPAGAGGAGGEGPATPASSSVSASGTGGASASSTSTGEAVGGGGAGGDGSGGGADTFLDGYPLRAPFPEGGTYDPTDHAFYVGSLGDGRVRRVDAASGLEEVVFQETAPGVWWTLGMAVDDARRRLWVCALEDRSETDEDPPYDGYVWLLDLETGERVSVFPLSEAFPEATCTDVAVRRDGTVVVTDRDFGNVYAIDADAGASLLVEDAELESSVIGQNAVVVLPDESALLIAIYLPPRLVRVDLEDGSVLDVEIEGDFFDSSPPLAGADGMTFHQGAIYVAFTSELVRIDPVLADWSSVSTTEVDLPDGMTDVVATPGGLYLLNGQAIAFAFGGETDPFALTRFVGEL